MSPHDILPGQAAFDLEYGKFANVGFVDKPMALLDMEYREPDYSSARRDDAALDRFDYSSYGRLATALSCGLGFDRQFVRANPWVLRHLCFIEEQAENTLQMMGHSTALFGSRINSKELHDLAKHSSGIISYASTLLMSDLPAAFHSAMCNQLRGAANHTSESPVAKLIQLAYNDSLASEGKGVRDSCVWRRLLWFLLRAGDLEPADTEPWLQLAEAIRQKCVSLPLQLRCPADAQQLH